MEISTFIFIYFSTLFIYISAILSKACFDEKGDRRQLIFIATISSSLLAILCATYLNSIFAIIIILIYSILLLCKNKILLIKKYTTISRSIFYVICFLIAIIQPLLVFTICIIEFFNTTFKKFNIKEELILNGLFLFCLTLLLFFS